MAQEMLEVFGNTLVFQYFSIFKQSVRNAIKHLGFETKDALTVADIENAQAIVFPGQGCFHQAISVC